MSEAIRSTRRSQLDRDRADVRPLFAPARLLKGNLLGLNEALESAKTELLAVRQETARRLEECARELAALRAQLDGEVLERTREGFAVGLEEGRAACAGMVEGLLVEIEKWKAHCAESVQRMAFLVARKILDVEFRLRPEAVVELTRQALERVRFCREVTLVAHPEDHALLAEAEASLVTRLAAAPRLLFRADPDLPRRSVRLETDRGVGDASLEKQFDALLARFVGPSDGRQRLTAGVRTCNRRTG